MANEAAPPTLAELEAAGLYDPDDEFAPQKLELLTLLTSLGATIDDMLADADRLPMIVTRYVTGGKDRYTVHQVAEQTGIATSTILDLWRAVGLVDPGDRSVFTDADIESFRFFASAADLVGPNQATQMARVLGSAMARVANASISMLVIDVGRGALQQDPTGLGLARQNLVISMMLPQFTGTMGTLLLHHIDVAQRSTDDVRRSQGDYDTLPLVVAFVDLVDSTVMTRTLGPDALGRALAAFEVEMSDLVTVHGGRIVKLIGDEAMFTCADPADACTIALEAAETFRSHPLLPPVRTGLAFGDVILREGDCFGPVVNLAARLVKLARPNGVVIDSALAEAIEGAAGFEVGSTIEHAVKGFDEPARYNELTRS